MPRMQLRRRVATWLGIFALVGSALGPVADSAHAAPLAQDQPATGIIVAIDEPTNRSGTAATRVLIRGWAADPASQRGTGVARVDVYLGGGPDQGGFLLGRANYGSDRADVADALGGQRFLQSGWDLVTDLPRGPLTLVAVAAPSGNRPALVVPGVVSIQATVGGMAGRTAASCGAGGYCTSTEGGGHSRAVGGGNDALYAGSLYQATGAFGNGATAPPYGWWDEHLDDLLPYLIAFRAYAYPYPQNFFGRTPNLYDQNLLTTLSTQGALAFGGTGCAGPAFGGLDILGLSTIGGYSYGFPQIRGIGITGFGTGTTGSPNQTIGGPFGTTSPLSIPFAGSLGGSLFAGGFTGGYNSSLLTLGRLNGGIGGPGGVGGTQSTGSGGFFGGIRGGANALGDTFVGGPCNIQF